MKIGMESCGCKTLVICYSTSCNMKGLVSGPSNADWKVTQKRKAVGFSYLRQILSARRIILRIVVVQSLNELASGTTLLAKVIVMRSFESNIFKSCLPFFSSFFSV